MRFNISFPVDSPVKDEAKKADVDTIANDVLMRVLMTRTYFNQIVEGKPYTDEHATSDARQYLQCAFMCCIEGSYGEALSWVKAANVVFCGEESSCALVVTYHDIWLVHEDATQWAVMTEGWINTMYGSVKNEIKIATIKSAKLSNGQAFLDRMYELRYGNKGWFAHCDQARACHKRLTEDMNNSFKYDN